MKESDMETVEWLTSPVLDAAMTYHRMEKELELEYKGQWVIIHGSQHIGEGFDSFHSTFSAAEEMGPNPLHCYIRQVSVDRVPIILL